MPFHEDELGTPVVEFGKGDIIMCTAKPINDGSYILVVFQDSREPGLIGSRPDKTSPEGTLDCETCMESKLKFLFDNTGSIDALMAVLLDARERLCGRTRTDNDLDAAVASACGSLFSSCRTKTRAGKP